MSNVLKKVVGGVYDELYYQYANKSTWKERLEIARRSKKAIAEAEKKRKEKEAAKAKEEAEKKPEEQKQEVKDEKSETTTAEKVSGEVVDGTTNQEVKQDEDKIPERKDIELMSDGLNALPEREKEIMLTYMEYDTGNGQYLPRNIIKTLCDKFKTTSPNLRKIKERSLKFLKQYVESRR